MKLSRRRAAAPLRHRAAAPPRRRAAPLPLPLPLPAALGRALNLYVDFFCFEFPGNILKYGQSESRIPSMDSAGVDRLGGCAPVCTAALFAVTLALRPRTMDAASEQNPLPRADSYIDVKNDKNV